ncbi:hypothetical protein L0152_03915 [bacterium]|nr:hypothetical protein [bacterium]
MSRIVRNIEYFYTTLSPKAGEAPELLENLASMGVNFVGLTVVPIGPDSVQITFFPEDTLLLQAVAKQIGLVIDGPHRAVLVQGDDVIGALAGIYKRVRQEEIQLYASNAVTDGKGHYGCILYLRGEDAGRAAQSLVS